MGRLLDDLLDVSRLSRGKLTLQRGPVVLRDALDAAIEINRPLIDRQRQDFSVECPQEMIVLDADEARLTQVLGNILNNAAKYSVPGARILVSVRLEQEMVVIGVRDEGLGIAEDMLERVFELFAQCDDARQQSPGGLGIGLSLARRLVEITAERSSRLVLALAVAASLSCGSRSCPASSLDLCIVNWDRQAARRACAVGCSLPTITSMRRK